MSVGLVLDAFIIRSLLVPSLIVLVGRVSAWPRRLTGSARTLPASTAVPSVDAMDAAPAQAPTRATLAVIALGVALDVLARKRD